MQTQQIVHLFNDDKFIDLTIDLFETTFPTKSVYYILKKKGEKLNFVKSTNIQRIDYEDDLEKFNFISTLNETSTTIVFFHALDVIKQDIALQLRKEIKKVWFVWGYDLYEKWPLLKKGIYEKETHKLINRNKSIKKKLIFNPISFSVFKMLVKIKAFLPTKLNQFVNNNFNTTYYKAVSSMDVLVPVTPNEYKIVKKINKKLIYAPFTYGSLEDLLGNNFDKNVLESNNILVGNSANPTNNHIDIFIKLSQVNLENRKIYVPLSYSGSEYYVSKVIEKGKELWGENFIPLKDFISLEAYNKILLSCNVLIFNHVRQQGVGNIVAMGFLGAKVFLNKKNPVYQYYKEEGFKIYSIDEINNSSVKKSLSKEVYLENKELFLNLYSKEKVIQKIEKLIEIVKDLKK
ncbi:TDP-N-acetylfucosamine:lipid II N-acetylfucosaminyltransferase [Flavobacterium sp.]|uniref:TDP-N-acetylfucosamine:lipid II N-acetylfucosaminyltransferase n=1 Tax=Flavobacterium sp. TaxID=239 RepID=UPI002BA4395B|nr:TDP-N-acetylfucosamine:lipid II N-acetylfucosaminyltransferase [Flavobacterium sp.]MCA0349683.1 TDP-N-acetylfucosamine:lipid II N-acetylfucosaminyltransferase [Bacteroidota bacterium]HQA73666.1 TDP-N-acetylfucosamine:lipid II N-acetylfucosaminyltransferase [Flavobacterium sp.]